ncbi:MAG TPA: BMC domain-containing protein [Lachnospiraceae bacterium]|nr:BMC domain-containing protein [Lachnospiraceae bacterium]
MTGLSTQEFLERIFHKDYAELRGKTLRMTRLRIPGREVCLAHILTPSDRSVYHNLGLHIGVHEGEDHMGDALGLIRFTPWEAVVAAADTAVKAADIEIGFMDRFCGSLIITGRLSEVETAVKEVVRFFRDELGFPVVNVTRS